MSGAEKRPPRSLKAIVLALLVGQNAGLVLATLEAIHASLAL